MDNQLPNEMRCKLVDIRINLNNKLTRNVYIKRMIGKWLA